MPYLITRRQKRQHHRSTNRHWPGCGYRKPVTTRSNSAFAHPSRFIDASEKTDAPGVKLSEKWSGENKHTSHTLHGVYTNPTILTPHDLLRKSDLYLMKLLTRDPVRRYQSSHAIAASTAAITNRMDASYRWKCSDCGSNYIALDPDCNFCQSNCDYFNAYRR